MQPEILSFLTIYAAFLCLFTAAAFAVWATQETLKEVQIAKRRKALRRATVLTRSVYRRAR